MGCEYLGVSSDVAAHVGLIASAATVVTTVGMNPLGLTIVTAQCLSGFAGSFFGVGLNRLQRYLSDSSKDLDRVDADPIREATPQRRHK